MKNVLFIVYYFPPMGGSGVQRPLKFAKYLREFGWNPIILCPEPGAYHKFDNSLMEELDSLDLEVHRVKGNTIFHSFGGTKREIKLPSWIESNLRKISTFFWMPDNKKGWIKPAFEKASNIIGHTKIDAVLASGPPHSNFMLANDIKQKFKIPFFADLRDDWLTSHLNSYPTKFHFTKMKKMESQTLNNADGLITINSKILDGIRNRVGNIDPSNSKVITHGFDPEILRKSNVLSARIKTKITFLYSGIFYSDSNPETFLRSMAKVLNRDNHLKEKVELLFQGGLRNEDKNLINDLGLEDLVTDLGYVSHKAAIENLLKADILWLNIGQKKNAGTISLGKTSEYFATKKPILGLVPDGEAKNLLQKYNRSYLADPYSIQQVTEQIQLLITDLEMNNVQEVNSDFINEFNVETLTQELGRFMSDILKTNSISG